MLAEYAGTCMLACIATFSLSPYQRVPYITTEANTTHLKAGKDLDVFLSHV